MQLRFDPTTGDDDEAFDTTRTALLGGFEEWLIQGGEGDETDAEGIAGDAGVLLDWRYRYSTGELDRYADADIAEFLVEWCPRKLSAPPETVRDFAIAIDLFVQFLAATDRLEGGAARAQQLGEAASALGPEAERAMADPSNFGMAKSMMGGLADLPDIDDPDELQALLDQRMAEFNALPLEQRMAITDGALPPELYTDVPTVYVPEPHAVLVESATASSLVRQIDVLRTYLGSDGRAIDEDGHLGAADEQELAALVQAGDMSGDELIAHLRFVVDVATVAEAVEDNGDRLIADEAWATLDIVERAEVVADALIDEGIVAVRSGGGDITAAVIDAAVIPALVTLFVEGATSRTELTARLASAMDFMRDGDGDDRDMGVDFDAVFDVLGQLNLVAADPEQAGDPDTVVLTALGRHVLAQIAGDHGFGIRTTDDLADAEVEELFELLLDPGVDGRAVLAVWQPALDDDGRARLIAEAMAATDRGAHRMIGIGLLNDMDPTVVEPHVRSLLDTPAAAGHAALWLIAHDLEQPEALEHLVGTGVLVDTMAATLAVPEVTADMFLDLDDPEEALDEMWHHDAPETAPVLEALGEHLDDRRLAKAARKALFRHRSWLANKSN